MQQNKSREWVYNQLEDEQSRYIYEKKSSFLDSGDYSYIEDIVKQYLPELPIYYPGKELDFIKGLTECDKNIVIYGCGYMGQEIYKLCKREGVSVKYFCDIDSKKWGGMLFDDEVEIVSYSEIEKNFILEDVIIIISPKFQYKEVERNLLEKGFPRENIFVFVEYGHATSEKQYFEEPIIRLEEEVFVDGGCLDLRTSQLLAKLCETNGKSIKKVYAFEPDKDNYKICNKKLSEGRISYDVSLIQAGLWSENTSLQFDALGNCSSHISIECNGEMDTINVVKMDSVIKDRVTFIKLDIEGAELEALKGAKDIIVRDKPKLAICIYHKKEDMVEIPYYIKQLVPEYKLYVRHYTNNENETVLYAVL